MVPRDSSDLLVTDAPPPAEGADVAPAASTARDRRWSLDVLRILAIVGVVSIHSFGSVMTDEGLHGTRGWWVAVVLDIGFIWAVPVFVMISGALVLEPRMFAKGPADFYRRRLLRLAVPFVFWQVFYLIVVRRFISGLDDGFAGLASLVLDGRTYTHLYFLWLIVGLYAVAPVLAAFLHAGGPRRAYIFAGATLAATVLTYTFSSLLASAGQARPLTLLALTQWIPYVGYFLAGWALRDTRPRGAMLFAVAGGAVLAVAEVIVQSATGPHPVWDAVLPMSYLGLMTAVASLCIFVAANGLLRDLHLAGWKARLVRELSDATFGVFLIHFVVLILVRRLPVFADALTSAPAAAGVWVLTTVLSFAIVMGMRRTPFVRRLV